MLRGRCQACQSPIGSSHVVFEIFASALALMAAFTLEDGLLLGVFIMSLPLWLTAFETDRLALLLPTTWFIPLGVMALAMAEFHPIYSWFFAGAGALVGGALYTTFNLYFKLRKGVWGFGSGDLPLLIVIGLWVGPLGVAMVFFGSAMIATAHMAIRYAMRHDAAVLGDRVPWGSYLIGTFFMTHLFLHVSIGR